MDGAADGVTSGSPPPDPSSGSFQNCILLIIIVCFCVVSRFTFLVLHKEDLVFEVGLGYLEESFVHLKLSPTPILLEQERNVRFAVRCGGKNGLFTTFKVDVDRGDVRRIRARFAKRDDFFKLRFEVEQG